MGKLWNHAKMLGYSTMNFKTLSLPWMQWKARRALRKGWWKSPKLPFYLAHRLNGENLFQLFLLHTQSTIILINKHWLFQGSVHSASGNERHVRNGMSFEEFKDETRIRNRKGLYTLRFSKPFGSLTWTSCRLHMLSAPWSQQIFLLVY